VEKWKLQQSQWWSRHVSFLALQITDRSLITICFTYSCENIFFGFDYWSEVSRFPDYLFSDKPGTTTAFPDDVSFQDYHDSGHLTNRKKLVPYAQWYAILDLRFLKGPDGITIGNPTLRTFDSSSSAQRAVTFLCLDFNGKSVTYNHLPPTACPSGVRAQIVSSWTKASLKD